LKIEPPMTAADVPKALAATKEKLDFWKGDQEAQTQRVSSHIISSLLLHKANIPQNIEKAKKEVERLDVEEAAAANGTHAPAPHANGETKATASVDEGGSVANEIELEKEAEEDVVADLKEASLEEKA
jgi:hypothetical protein